jgi:hypothetical protein
VPDPAASTRNSTASDEAAIASLAKETQTPTQVVRRLYDQEMAALHGNARVKNFIGVIAARRVKKHLNAPKGK